MPITFGLLAKLFNYLQNVIFNSVIGLGLQTACLVAFRGFFRCGEFTCWTSFDNNIHLCIGDINFVSHDCVKLFLKTSKTVVIQWVYIKLLKTDSDLCPYKLLMKFIINRKSCNTTQKDSLFVQEHNTALSRNYFISKLKALISCLCFVIIVDIHMGNNNLCLQRYPRTYDANALWDTLERQTAIYILHKSWYAID